jgi:signal transduction histidine kinase
VEERCFDINISAISWEGFDRFLYSNNRTGLLNINVANLLDQTRYKDRVLATVSHDLRTPLNGLIGILELALKTTT